MTEVAKEWAEIIANALRRNDPSAIFELERNLQAHIVNAAAYAEPTADVRRTADSLRKAVDAFLRSGAGPLGIRQSSEASEAAREKALTAAVDFENALLAAPASGKAKALGLF